MHLESFGCSVLWSTSFGMITILTKTAEVAVIKIPALARRDVELAKTHLRFYTFVHCVSQEEYSANES